MRMRGAEQLLVTLVCDPLARMSLQQFRQITLEGLLSQLAQVLAVLRFHGFTQGESSLCVFYHAHQFFVHGRAGPGLTSCFSSV
jgi:hypothetical protein